MKKICLLLYFVSSIVYAEDNDFYRFEKEMSQTVKTVAPSENLANTLSNDFKQEHNDAYFKLLESGDLKAAQREVNKELNREGSVGSFLKENINTRPLYRISGQEDYIKDNRVLIKNADKVFVENPSVKEEESTCKYRKEECFESTRSMIRNCSVTPRVTIKTKKDICPNCKDHRLFDKWLYDYWRTKPPGCPKGSVLEFQKKVYEGKYFQIWATSCSRLVEGEELKYCFTGTFVFSGVINYHNLRGSGNVFPESKAIGVVPKGFRGYIEAVSYRRDYWYRIIDKETGQELCVVKTERKQDKAEDTTGKIVALPYYEDRDLTIEIINLTNIYSDKNDLSAYGFAKLLIQHVKADLTSEVEWVEVCNE